VRRGLLAGDAEQRADDDPVARRHPEQRPAPGRGREPVEDRLGLIALRVPGRHPRAARGRERRRGGVAGVARPGLEVAAGRRRGCALDLDPDPEPRRERPAVRLVALGLLAPQPVVDVQRGHRLDPGDPDRDVEQAHGVAPAGDHDDDRRARLEEAGGTDAVEQVGHLRG
jgi:hypothetical protein